MDGPHSGRRAFLVDGAALAGSLVLGCGGAATADGARTGTGRSDGGGVLGGAAVASGGAGAVVGGAGTVGGGGSHAGAAGAAGSGDGGEGVDAGGGAHCSSTRPDIEGPFFTPESPERTTLREPDMPGTLLTVRGRVLDPACVPVSNATIDFWQADADGAYDRVGFRLRGHQRVDGEGRYELETIVPGRYLNGAQYRPAHIHVKVYVGTREALTTQLYFQGDPFGASDPWFSEETALAPVASAGSLEADFDFHVV